MKSLTAQLTFSYAMLGLVLLIIGGLALEGCNGLGSAPSGPTTNIDARGAQGTTITANTNIGSGNSIGTAPCASKAAQKQADNSPADPQDCSVQTIQTPPQEPQA